MFSDTLFRIVNIAGGLGLDGELWRREVLGPATGRAEARRSARRRITEAAGTWCEQAAARVPRARPLRQA